MLIGLFGVNVGMGIPFIIVRSRACRALILVCAENRTSSILIVIKVTSTSEVLVTLFLWMRERYFFGGCAPKPPLCACALSHLGREFWLDRVSCRAYDRHAQSDAAIPEIRRCCVLLWPLTCKMQARRGTMNWKIILK